MDSLESPRLKRLHGDWLARRNGRLMPARADFDILDLKYLMGNLNLFDVLRNPLRFQFRVHGSNAVARLGYDLTGRTVDDYPDPEYRDFVNANYRAVVETRAPRRVLRDQPYYTNDRVLRWEGLILPLASDGEMVDMLIVGLDLL